MTQYSPGSVEPMSVTKTDIEARLLERIRAHVLACYAQEGCGILTGGVHGDTATVQRVLPCPNQADPDVRHRRFEIDPRAVLNLQRTLRSTAERVIGFYHSHPDGAAQPSSLDMDHIRLWPNTVWLIASVSGGRQADLRAWWLDSHAGSAIRELSITTTRAAAPVCI